MSCRIEILPEEVSAVAGSGVDVRVRIFPVESPAEIVGDPSPLVVQFAAPPVFDISGVSVADLLFLKILFLLHH